MKFKLPPRVVDHTAYSNMPSDNGVLFTFPFSKWLAANIDYVKLVPDPPHGVFFHIEDEAKADEFAWLWI